MSDQDMLYEVSDHIATITFNRPDERNTISIDDLFGRRALVDRCAIGEQGDVGEVLHAALTQMVDGDANVVQ